MAASAVKVVLLGEGRVGKTSLISRFVHDSFNPEEVSTVQANMYSTKEVPVGGTGGSRADRALRSLNLAIWDTAGQERFHALAPMYYRNAEGAIIVYDVTDADTLRKVRTWARELHAVVGEDTIQLVICGNKADYPEGEREVTEEAAKSMAAELGAVHCWTSAKTGKGVPELFSAIATQIARHAEGSASTSTSLMSGGVLPVSRARPRRGLQVVSEDGVPISSGQDIGGGVATSSSASRFFSSATPPRAHRYATGARPVTFLDDEPTGEQRAGASGSASCC